MGHNGDSAPAPILSTLEQEWEYLYKLPRRLRIFLVECRYEYNTKQVYDTYMLLQRQYGMFPQQAEAEMMHQLELNDSETVRQEMEKKWKSIGMSTPPLTTFSKKQRPNLPTRRTATIASRLGMHRFVRGTKPPQTSAIPQGMVFDLFGTALRRRKIRTTTGSNSRKPMDGITGQ